MRTRLVNVASLVAVLATTVAHAGPPGPDAAAQTAAPPAASEPAAAAPKPLDPKAMAEKKRGDAAMESLHYSDALEAYRAAYAIDPAPQLLYNMGRALQAMGRYPQALESFEQFQREAPPELIAKVPRLGELVSEVRAEVADVTFEIPVDGARVLVRREVVGKAPFPNAIRLNAGTADVEVTAAGFAPFRMRVELPGGGSVSIPVELRRLSNEGLLTVRSPVEGAVVFIDGKRAGTVPSEAVVVAGRHVVVLRREGYDEAESSVVVRAGERQLLDVPLAETPPITGRWWFWVGAGAVVAGGVALTVALVTERDPDSGSIPPGQLGTALSF